MSQHVQMPDGSLAEFPDGMTQAEIEAALSAHADAIATSPSLRAAPAQMTGFERTPALLTTNTLEGLEDTVGLPGTLLQKGVSLLPDSVRGAVQTGLNYSTLSLPSATDLHGITASLGLTDRSDLIPGWTGNDWEKTLAAGARGYGSAIPAALLGPGEAAFPALASGTAGGSAEELWHSQHLNDPLGGFIAGTVAGAGVGNLANAGTRMIRSATGRFNPAGAEFIAAGLPMRSAALTGKASTRNLLGQFVPSEQTHGDIYSAVSELANGLGQSTTLQKAGTHLQADAEGWLKTTMPAKEDLAWKPVDRAIPPTTATTLANFEGTLKGIVNRGGSLSTLIEKLQPTLPVQLLKSLNARGQLAGLLNGSVAPTWSEARALRSAIGRAMAEPSIVNKAGPLNLKAMYAGITKDLSTVATAHNAGDLFSAANAESTRLHGFAENLLSNVVGSKGGRGNPNPEDAAKYFLNMADLKRGGSDLVALGSELPQSTRELAAAHLHSIANPTGANPPTVGKNLLNVWDKMSPEARAALLPPSARARMNALAGVSRRLLTLPGPRPGGAAGHATGMGLGATALTMAGAGVHHFLGGHPLGLETLAEIAGGSSTLGAIAGGARDRVLSGLANSPAAARYAASLPPGWVLPPTITGALGAGAGEQDELGLVPGR